MGKTAFAIIVSATTKFREYVAGIECRLIRFAAISKEVVTTVCEAVEENPADAPSPISR
jgi:hypothetical protein